MNTQIIDLELHIVNTSPELWCGMCGKPCTAADWRLTQIAPCAGRPALITKRSHCCGGTLYRDELLLDRYADPEKGWFKPDKPFCKSTAQAFGFFSTANRNDKIGSCACDGIFHASLEVIGSYYNSRDDAEKALAVTFWQYFVESMDEPEVEK